MAVPSSAPPSSLQGGHLPSPTLSDATVPYDGEPLNSRPAPKLSVPLSPGQAETGPQAAARGARRALDGTKWFGHKILSLCEQADGLIAGKRLAMFGGLGLVVGATTAAESLNSGTPSILTTVSGIVLLYFVWLLVFSFVGSLRDDTGVWSGALVFARMKALAQAGLEYAETFSSSPPHLRWRFSAWVVGVLTLSAFAAANLVALLERASSGLFITKGLKDLSSGIAANAWFGALLTAILVGLWRATRPKRRTIQNFGSSVAREIIGDLPPILALGTSDLPMKGDTIVHEILDVLSQWRPRLWPTEKDYQLALERHFERTLSGVLVEREKCLGQSRSDGIADFVVAGAVILELKRGFSRKSEINRAIGQMQDYARQCPEMPSLLVLFDANLSNVVRSRWTAALIDLHARQASLTVRMPVPRKPKGGLAT